MLRIAGRIIYKILKPFGGYVLLSDGFVCRVRRMALYELDAIEYEDIGPYYYTYVNKVTGKETPTLFDISQFTTPPKPPLIPEDQCDPHSMEFGLWHVYNNYQAALLHRLKQVDAAKAYAEDVSRYVLDHCISPRARGHVSTADDYRSIYEAALTPEVAAEDIETALQSVFPGVFSGSADFQGA